MGLQIAALFTNYGIPCLLLDRSFKGRKGQAVAEERMQSLLAMQPSPLSSPQNSDLIQMGSLAEDLPKLEQADWVIEAVTEKLHVKRQVWSEVAQYIAKSLILSSTTAAIPLSAISVGLPPGLRSRFLGVHFFHPPRYMRLVEIVPQKETSDSVIRHTQRMVEHAMGKASVLSEDTAGFIANRIGCYAFLVCMNAMEKYGLRPDEVDELSRSNMAGPKTATFKALDVVGIDLFARICDSICAFVEDPEEQRLFEVPEYLKEMLARGMWGGPHRNGFYTRPGDEAGEEMVFLPSSQEYVPVKRQSRGSPSTAHQQASGVAGFLEMLSGEDTRSRFAWEVVSRTLAYAAWRVNEISQDTATIDKAMHYAFGWSPGPFKLWEELGIKRVVDRMRTEDIELPSWVLEQSGRSTTFYDTRISLSG